MDVALSSVEAILIWVLDGKISAVLIASGVVLKSLTSRSSVVETSLCVDISDVERRLLVSSG